MEAMRRLLATGMAAGLLATALGCHHTQSCIVGICDCDIHGVHGAHPVYAAHTAPALKPEPIKEMPKAAEAPQLIEAPKEKVALSIEELAPARTGPSW
jgi:hypothetical protein